MKNTKAELEKSKQFVENLVSEVKEGDYFVRQIGNREIIDLG